MKKLFAQIYIWLLLALLYAPLVFIAIFSFTESRVLGNWTGFSTKLYGNLFTGGMNGGGALLSAVENTLIIALIAAAVSTLLGTIAAIGIYNLRGRKKQTMQFLNNIPMINPDIITGVSLFLLFVFLGFSQGYVTVVLAHITFCTPYVVLNVMPKLSQPSSTSSSFPVFFTERMIVSRSRGLIVRRSITSTPTPSSRRRARSSR